MTLTKVISIYLQSHRRITVPALGTFLSKGEGEPILFSEFMKSDDGVLRELLSTELGMSELEAAVFIDRFVFELRHAMESCGTFEMPMLGYMRSEDGRTFNFEFDPTIVESEEAESATIEEEATEPTNELDIVDQAQEEEEEAETPQEEPIEEDESEDDVENLYRTNHSEVESAPKGKIKIDFWMVIAVIALLFAIGAVCYGLMVEWIVGNISFGEGIDNVLESLFSSESGAWLEDAMTPEATGSVIPQDTVIINIRK